MEVNVNSLVNVPRLWSQLAYAGETRVPAGAAPRAGSWPTYFLKRDEQGRFVDQAGRPVTFAIRTPDTFNFNAQLAVVKETLKNLTAGQIAIAEYWGDGPLTKQWTPIADILADTYGVSSPKAERIWAASMAATNDAIVVAWYFKYLWEVPRPDQLDQTLATVLCTPKHPSYPAGHAVGAGCIEMVLSHFFTPEAERLHQLAEECALSRLYAGVHYPADLEQGLRLGRQIGTLVVATLAAQSDGDAAAIDYPLQNNLHAILPPPPYEQVIPFARNQHCDSLTIPHEQ